MGGLSRPPNNLRMILEGLVTTLSPEGTPPTSLMGLDRRRLDADAGPAAVQHVADSGTEISAATARGSFDVTDDVLLLGASRNRRCRAAAEPGASDVDPRLSGVGGGGRFCYEFRITSIDDSTERVDDAGGGHAFRDAPRPVLASTGRRTSGARGGDSSPTADGETLPRAEIEAEYRKWETIVVAKTGGPAEIGGVRAAGSGHVGLDIAPGLPGVLPPRPVSRLWSRPM